MTRGFSKAIITGNLTRDPEVRALPSGTSVTNFAVAVNRVYRDSNGENKEDVSFFDCVAWGKAGEIINQYARKGTGILVSGRLSQRTWDDKNGGGKRARVEIVVEDFNFLGGSSENRNDSSYGGGDSYGGSSSYSAPAPAGGTSADVVPDDIDPNGEVDLSEIPF